MSADVPDGFSVIDLAVRVGARDRSALVCRPTAPPPPGGWPVVLAFHGGRSHPDMMRRVSGLDVLAAHGRSVVCYPAGPHRLDS